MPTYKLSYFNITGLGESIRFLLSYGGVPFEDHRIEPAEWSALKSNFPMGQLPVLEIDGIPHYQSMAISRYLAHTFNIAGNNDLENLEIDQIVSTISDFCKQLNLASQQIRACKDETSKPDFINFYLGKLDAQAKENNGYLVHGRLTWADLFFVSLLYFMDSSVPFDLIGESPNLQKVKENVVAIENIKTWIDTRPKTVK